MNQTAELLEHLAAQMADIRSRLEQLRSAHAKSAALKQTVELERNLSRQISDAKARLAKHEDIEAKSLADSIDNGMQQMIAIISSDDRSASS
jgi:hypothetical protein